MNINQLFCSCLDILSDYLRGRQYPHERIDGSVPSDQRQASIDRFSTMPITESFVFLLCTRAGGVGINLTVSTETKKKKTNNMYRLIFVFSHLGCRYLYYL